MNPNREPIEMKVRRVATSWVHPKSKFPVATSSNAISPHRVDRYVESEDLGSLFTTPRPLCQIWTETLAMVHGSLLRACPRRDISPYAPDPSDRTCRPRLLGPDTNIITASPNR